MEIKLKAGDKIQIPTDCKAYIENNQIIIEEQKEEQAFEDFKEGDILHANIADLIVIFKCYHENDKKHFDSYYNNIKSSYNSGWANCNFRHATEEEKQRFFDELFAKDLRWNAETKIMKKIRFKVDVGEDYLHIDAFGRLVRSSENGSSFDDENFKFGNYYSILERKQAEEDAKAIKAIFEKRVKV